MLTNFNDDLQEWMEHRFLNPILIQGDGWESWIQIDFPAYLDTRDEKRYDIRPGYPITEQNHLAWLINSRIDGQPSAIEIKAQTYKTPTDIFLQAVKNDVKVLKTLGGQRIMLCAVADPGAAEKLEQQGFERIFTFPGKWSAFYRKTIED